MGAWKRSVSRGRAPQRSLHYEPQQSLILYLRILLGAWRIVFGLAWEDVRGLPVSVHCVHFCSTKPNTRGNSSKNTNLFPECGPSFRGF